MLALYPHIIFNIITLAIGFGGISCTIVTNSLFCFGKQYCGTTLGEIIKYYT